MPIFDRVGNRMRIYIGMGAAAAAVAVGAIVIDQGGSNPPPPAGACSDTAGGVIDGPDGKGGCWPGPQTTGPSGTLTAYTSPCTITVANTVIDSKTVNCSLHISTTGVTIKNSQINGTVQTSTSAASFTLTDSLVDATGIPGADILGNEATNVGAENFTMTRTEVVGGRRSVNCDNNCTVSDSYVHGQFHDVTGQAHESGMRMSSNTNYIHNSIGCDAVPAPPGAGCSGDLTGYGDYAPVEHNLIQNNLFLTTTGGICAYGGSSGGKPYSADANNIRFIGNRWQYGTVNDHGRPDCAYYFAVDAFDSNAPGNVWSDNKYVDGVVINP